MSLCHLSVDVECGSGSGSRRNKEQVDTQVSTQFICSLHNPGEERYFGRKFISLHDKLIIIVFGSSFCVEITQWVLGIPCIL